MVLETLKEVNALLEGHFLLSSGKHSNKYCQCAKLFEFPEKAADVTKTVAQKIVDAKVEVDLIVGPAMGGIIAAYELAGQLGKRNIFIERVDNVMSLRRGFAINAGEKVIIMEDVITTGKSSMEVADIIKENGGEVVALACIVDRSVVELDLPVFSAVKLDVEVFDADCCPMCAQDIAFEKPGSRKQ